MKPELQVALDVLNIEKALHLAGAVAEYVDIIELGTPLLKSESTRELIKIMRANFPNKKILADMKIMDVGEMEAKLAFNAGADMVTVCAAAGIETIKNVVKTARKMKKEAVVDLIGIENEKQRIEKAIVIAKLKPDYICVHTGIDEKKAITFSDIKKLKELRTKISVAGGIDLNNIKKILEFKPSIIVVGRTITHAAKPEEEAKKIASMIKGKFAKTKILKIKAQKLKPLMLPLKEIEHELKKVLEKINLGATEQLLEQIQQAKKIFVTGQGRSGLIGDTFAMRLSQLGLKVYVVGEVTTPAISEDDLLIAISGSGKTKLTYDIAKEAKAENAINAVITANKNSRIARLANILVLIETDINGKEPLGSLFEQATLLYLDSLVMELMKRLGKTEKEMRKIHANL